MNTISAALRRMLLHKPLLLLLEHWMLGYRSTMRYDSVQKFFRTDTTLKLIALRVVAQATECESAIVAAQAIPDPAADGVASVYELQTRWPRLAESVRQAALVPDEGATLAWHMYAKVMSKLTIQDRKGLGEKDSVTVLF